jgi:hypothetical protein
VTAPANPHALLPGNNRRAHPHSDCIAILYRVQINVITIIAGPMAEGKIGSNLVRIQAAATRPHRTKHHSLAPIRWQQRINGKKVQRLVLAPNNQPRPCR